MVYGENSKKIRSVGRQNKNNVIWFIGWAFFQKWYFDTEENLQFLIYYNKDKCFLVLVIYISLLCLTSSFIFFFKKQKIIDFKKASRTKFCNIIFLFFLKIGSIGPIEQQLNLFSPYLWKRCFDWTFLRYVPNETSTSLNLNDFRPKAPPGCVL